MTGQLHRNSLPIAVMLAGILLCTPLFANEYRTRQHQLLAYDILQSDIEAEIQFGQEVAARILGREARYIDDKLTRYINLIGKTLVLHSGRHDINYYFIVIDNDYANAFSAPGGYIFISSGALRIAEDESEIAAVLAHEIAHITARHIIKDMDIKGSDNSAVSGLTQFLSTFSDVTRVAINQAADKAINILFSEGYKIEEEFEADDIAMQLLAETGYDPTALYRYLARADTQGKDIETSGKKTHPSPAARYAKLADHIASENFDKLDFPRMSTRFRDQVKLHH